MVVNDVHNNGDDDSHHGQGNDHPQMMVWMMLMTVSMVLLMITTPTVSDSPYPSSHATYLASSCDCFNTRPWEARNLRPKGNV